MIVFGLIFKLGNLFVKLNFNKFIVKVLFWIVSNGKIWWNFKIELLKLCSNKIGVLFWFFDKKVVLIGWEIKGVKIDLDWIFWVKLIDIDLVRFVVNFGKKLGNIGINKNFGLILNYSLI